MPQNERLRVWKGELKKTSGGLTKAHLTKNKRGKVVSRKKSDAAKKNKENNLGEWLRSKGDKFLSKGITENDIKRKLAPKKAAPKPAPKKAAPKPVPKAAKKKPTITKSEPIKPGEDKDLTKVSVGNISTKSVTDVRAEKRAARKYEAALKRYKMMGYSSAKILKKLGPPPRLAKL